MKGRVLWLGHLAAVLALAYLVLSMVPASAIAGEADASAASQADAWWGESVSLMAQGDPGATFPEVTDTLTRDVTGATSSSYGDWNSVRGDSGAVYAGNSNSAGGTIPSSCAATMVNPLPVSSPPAPAERRFRSPLFGTTKR